MPPQHRLSLSGLQIEPFSHHAPPFIPGQCIGFSHGIASPADLFAALQHAVSVDHLHSLLMHHERMLTGPCVLAATHRLQQLFPHGAPLSDFQAAALRLQRLALVHEATLAADCLLSVYSCAARLHLPDGPEAHELLRLACGRAHSLSPTGLAALGGALLIPARRDAADTGSVPRGAPPEALALVRHGVQLHASALSAHDVVALLQVLVHSRCDDVQLHHALAARFHDSQHSWDAESALAFLGLCRAHKPLLAAQRQQNTLSAVLAFLQPLVPQCDTRQIATAVLDMAFVGYQGFKAHGILRAVSEELSGRLESGLLGPEHAIELADAIKALDKLDHCNDRLSRAACPVLAAGQLPAKHIANVVVSLAKQKHLSSALADSARELLSTQLSSCNGQDVSQILFGLMLDKQGLRKTHEVFKAIAPELAQRLRDRDAFQTQAVSRILSSYAKVGCFSPMVFDSGIKRLTNSLNDLRPAYVSELAWSLSVAEQGQQAFMKRLAAAIKRRFHEFNPSMLCSTLWAFSHAHTFHAELFNMTCSKLANLLSRNQLSLQDLVQAMTGVAQSNFRHTGLLAAVHDHLLHQQPAAPLAATASLLSSLETFGCASDSLLNALLPSALNQLPSLTDKAKLVQLLCAYAAAADPSRYTDVFDAVEDRLVQQGLAQGKRLSPGELAALAAGLGRIGRGGCERLASALAAEATVRLGEASEAQAADLVWGLCEVGHLDETLMARAAAQLAPELASLDGGRTAMVLTAFAHVCMPAPALFQAGEAAVGCKLQAGTLSPVQAANIAWAFAVQGHAGLPLVEQLCALVKEDAANCNHELYHMRRSTHRLSTQDLARLHVVAALVRAAQRDSAHDSWQAGPPPPVVGEPLAQAARAAFAQVLGATRAGEAGAGGLRAAKVTQEVLRSTFGNVASAAPASVTKLDIDASMLQLVDLWCEDRRGRPVGVVLLSRSHCLESRPAQPAGWVEASLGELKGSVPGLVVVPWHLLPDLDYKTVHAHVTAQLNPGPR